MVKKGISGSTLKIIAVIAMIMDHTAWCLFDVALMRKGVMLPNIYAPLKQISVSPVLCILSPVFHIIGRITFPIMLFLLLEGVKYTRNKIKYLRNMAVFALISEIPFNLAFRLRLYSPGKIIPYIEGQNVFVTLTLGLFALIIAEEIRNRLRVTKLSEILSFFALGFSALAFSWFFIKKTLENFGYKTNYTIVGVMAVILFIAAIIIQSRLEKEANIKFNLSLGVFAAAALMTYALDSDYRFVGVAALGVMYFLRENKISSLTAGDAYLTLHSVTEAGAFLSLPLIALYNGKRGLSLKYLFYIVYPAHLLILWGLRVLF